MVTGRCGSMTLKSMSSFCKQCFEHCLQEDQRDFILSDFVHRMVVDCEGCGHCAVDKDGKCLTHTPEEHAVIWKTQV
jgi:Pyruvate/2-oxoacid:ferredoxin oxidoreductase delta subunit